MIDVFHRCAAVAVELSNAQVVNKDLLSVERSVRDWDANKRQTYMYSIPLNGDTASIPIQLESTTVFRLASPSGNKMLIVKSNGNNSKTETDTNIKNNIVEIWQGTSRVRRISLEKVHGSIITKDVTFGSPSWSLDETFCVYAAERLPTVTTSYWDLDDTKEKGVQNVLGKGVAEDWGEKYGTQEPLLDLYVLHTLTGRVERIPFLDDQFYNCDSRLGSVSLGQPVLHPNHPIVAFTCFDAGGLGSMKRRLGMIYCRNRPSQIYTANIQAIVTRLNVELENTGIQEELQVPLIETTCISSDFALARSPRFVSLTNGDVSLLFLGNKKGFLSHDGCMGLYSADGNELLPPVDIPMSEGPQVEKLGFPGIFTGELPVNCAIPGTNFILVSTLWGSITRLIIVDVVSSKWDLLEITDGGSLSSHGFLCHIPCAEGIGLIVSETSPNLSCRLWKVVLPSEISSSMTCLKGQAIPLCELGSIACTAYSPVPPHWDPPFDVKLETIPTDTTPIQALVLIPRQKNGNSKLPLVVVPHGGPHSASTSAYVPGFAMLATRYVVVLPNYRGSTGFGQAPLTSLLTQVGRTDVDDVMACTQHVLDKYPIDSGRVGICGGSHGGFLAAHCTSQYPTFFRAAVMRNPVTNIASMITTTDIPDWCFAECLGESYPFRGPTKEEMNSLYDKSPISKVGNVETPTLIALGMQDLRVPPSQGKEWYYTLRSKGVPTELLVYPKDDHSLSTVATEADHWIRIMRWFELYL